MKVIDEQFNVDEFLTRPLMATLTTASNSGPCETPVWFLWEGGALWIIASLDSSFPGRLTHDGRSAIGIVDFDLDCGFLQHLGLRGTAYVMPMDSVSSVAAGPALARLRGHMESLVQAPWSSA
jgi:hypothetical protein